jgi:hypothetical protein
MRPPRQSDTVLLELPAARAASLATWLRCAAVVVEVCPEGVLVDQRKNRLLGSAALTLLVREWMQAHNVDTIFASSRGDVFSITDDVAGASYAAELTPCQPGLTAEDQGETRGLLDARAAGLEGR